MDDLIRKASALAIRRGECRAFLIGGTRDVLSRTDFQTD